MTFCFVFFFTLVCCAKAYYYLLSKSLTFKPCSMVRYKVHFVLYCVYVLTCCMCIFFPRKIPKTLNNQVITLVHLTLLQSTRWVQMILQHSLSLLLFSSFLLYLHRTHLQRTNKLSSNYTVQCFCMYSTIIVCTYSSIVHDMTHNILFATVYDYTSGNDADHDEHCNR